MPNSFADKENSDLCSACAILLPGTCFHIYPVTVYMSPGQRSARPGRNAQCSLRAPITPATVLSPDRYSAPCTDTQVCNTSFLNKLNSLEGNNKSHCLLSTHSGPRAVRSSTQTSEHHHRMTAALLLLPFHR